MELYHQRPESASQNQEQLRREASLINSQDVSQEEWDILRESLFVAAATDDIRGFDEAWKEVQTKKKSLTHPLMLYTNDKRNVFHHALICGAKGMAEHLINDGGHELLTQTYEVVVRNAPVSKTALHLLSESGDLDMIRKLLSKIPKGKLLKEYLSETLITEPAGQRPRPLPAIHLAALHGHTELVEYLVKTHKVDVNTTNIKNDTAVLWASRGDNIETVRKLIKLGADLNHQNDKGSTPLYWGCRYGLTDMVRVLLEEGHANVNQKRKLGLVSPIVLTSALGYAEITELLLRHGADVNLTIQSGFCPLHHAAAEGNVEVIKLLIGKGANINQSNDFGDTAILLAAKHQHREALSLLAYSGAYLNGVNKNGKGVWHYAVECDDSELLAVFVSCYQRLNNLKSNQLKFPEGKTPLHLAAMNGDCDKINFLLKAGADADAQDEGGNTFVHLAAREGRENILNQFVDSVDFNRKNGESETPLHLAIRSGHPNVIKMLLKKSDLKVRNCSEETVLHVACKSSDISVDIVQMIVDEIVKAHNWSLVDSTDRCGNTALHIAARGGHLSLIPALKTLNPRVQNAIGDSPLHAAVRNGHYEVVDTIFDIFEKDINIDLQNHDGETLMHIAADLGDDTLAKYLIEHGANLSLVNNDGNTVLHSLVDLCVEDPINSSSYMRVFNTILDNAVRWWCMKADLHYPDEDSDIYDHYRHKALIQLTSVLSNRYKLSVMLYAAKEGAKEILETILHIPEVYLDRKDKHVIFDVTHLIPDTNHRIKTERMRTGKVSPDSNANIPKDVEEITECNTTSCIDLIVRHDNINVAKEMMDIVPLQQMVADIWSVYKFMYILILSIHVIYMFLISIYGIPLLDSIRIGNTTVEPVNHMPHGLYVIWPGIFLIYELYYMASSIFLWIREVGRHLGVKDWRKCSPFSLIKIMITTIFSYLDHVANFCFGSLIISWYALYVLNSPVQLEVLACGIIIGWMCALSFTNGFENLHSFSIMLKKIIMTDIVKFLMLYIVVLLAFSFGFKALLWVVPDIRSTFPDSIDYVFMTFQIMVGQESLFGGLHEAELLGFPGLEWTTKVVYVFYILLTTVILLNLLIAMMTDSYSVVKSKEGTNWRVGSVHLALQLEKSIPIIPKMLKCCGIKSLPLTKNYETGRWLLTLNAHEVSLSRLEEQTAMQRSLHRLQRDVTSLKSGMDDLFEAVGSLTEKITKLQATSSAAGPPPKLLRRRTSMYQVAMKVMGKR